MYCDEKGSSVENFDWSRSLCNNSTRYHASTNAGVLSSIQKLWGTFWPPSQKYNSKSGKFIPIWRSPSKVLVRKLLVSLCQNKLRCPSFGAGFKKLLVPRAIQNKALCASILACVNWLVPKTLAGGHWLEFFNKFSLNQCHQITVEVFSTQPITGVIWVSTFIFHEINFASQFQFLKK